MARFAARLGITRYEADEFYRLAIDFYNKHNMEEALNNMNNAIDLNPHRAEYYAARAFFNIENGLPAEKIHPDLDEALSRNPYEVMGNYGKGVLAYNAEDYELAREFFSKAWAAMPERAETMYYLAMVEHRMENNQQAIYWMKQAVEIFDANDDRNIRRRGRNAERWINEFEKQIERVRRVEQGITINPDR